MAEGTPERSARPALWVWRGALGFFILAGLTGAFFRFATAGGFSLGLSLGNIRHAHSHTMYFGWVTPSLMGLIAYRLAKLGYEGMRKVGPAIVLAFVTALLSYVPFLLYGYTPAVLGSTRLPLSMIGAGLNVMAWYWFVVLYVRARTTDAPSPAIRLFDLAVFFLVLATLGAWGLSGLQIVGYDNLALRTALTHVFLDIFSEGWFVLGVLGLAAAEAPLEGSIPTWGIRLAALGIPFTFALGMPASLVSPLFRLLSSIGGVLVAAGLLLVAIPLWRQLARAERLDVRRMWRFAIGALVLKALAEGAVSIAPDASWAGLPQLRIIYLHVVLLGFVSVGLVASARSAWGSVATRGRSAFIVAIAVLLLSLLPFAPIWPLAWRGVGLLWVIAIAALGPTLAAGWMLVRMRKS
ncbi:MAG: hypothetical protein WBW88_17205 [Rhodothermales bacterium]